MALAVIVVFGEMTRNPYGTGTVALPGPAGDPVTGQLLKYLNFDIGSAVIGSQVFISPIKATTSQRTF